MSGSAGATHSSGGGCSTSGRSTSGALAGLFVAMALAVPAWRRRRRRAR
jgi:MYXO-CTERM domain-containing protein